MFFQIFLAINSIEKMNIFTDANKLETKVVSELDDIIAFIIKDGIDDFPQSLEYICNLSLRVCISVSTQFV